MFTIVDVVLEANPDSAALLRSLVLALAAKEDPRTPGAATFPRLQQVPRLHFLSLEIFEDPHWDPLLVLENNIDGDPQSYWPGLLVQFSDDLRAIFACTKPALDPQWQPLFAPGSALPLTDFLVQHSVFPSAAHIGAVGVQLTRANRDRQLFTALQTELGIANPKYLSQTATGLHQSLRGWATASFPWFSQPEDSSITKGRRDYRLSHLKRPLFILLRIAIAIAALCTLAFSGLLTRFHLESTRLLLATTLEYIGAFLAAVLLLIVLPFLIWLWTTLRKLEKTDTTQDDLTLNPEDLAAFASQEDQIVQNHLASMVLVKPGAVRAIVLRASMWLLGVYATTTQYKGSLGGILSIHCAHWAYIGNASRLMFFSNFDGSWQSYLDDFVDKSHLGLTLAWTCCTGFPRTNDLIFGGATHGPQFKTWARRSQTQSLLWYSAYKDLTVAQILRNASIVDGLRQTTMSDAQAQQWAELL